MTYLQRCEKWKRLYGFKNFAPRPSPCDLRAVRLTLAVVNVTTSMALFMQIEQFLGYSGWAQSSGGAPVGVRVRIFRGLYVPLRCTFDGLEVQEAVMEHDKFDL